MHVPPRSILCGLFITGLGVPGYADAQLQQLFRAIPNFNQNVQNMQAGTTCSQLKQWVSSVPSAAGSRRQEDLLPLLDDAHFGKVFRKSYEQLTVADFREFQQGMAECQRAGTFTPGEAQTVQYLLNQSMHPTLSRQLAAARTQRAQYETMLAELDKLQPTEADVRRLASIQTELNASLRSASPEQRQAAAARVEATRARIVGPMQKERVAKAVEEAQGVEGLSSLATLYDDLGKSGLAASEIDALRQPVRQRMNELGTPLVQEERDTASAIGSGLPGLERGVQFLTRFETKYQRTARVLPDLEAVRREVLDQRAAMLPGLESAILSEVRNAKSAQQVNDVLNRYLTASERQGSQRHIVSAAQEHSAALQRKGENERVFGSTSDPTTTSTQLASRAPSSRASRGFLTDPNELRKYNEGRLIKAIYDGDLSRLPSDKAFVRAYLLQHARVFADPCKMFTMAEIRQFENSAMRDQLPRTQAEMGQQALQSLKMMMTNPRGMADMAAAQQKREDAPELADKDLEVLVETYGACNSPVMKQYAKNVGNYLRNAGQ